MDRTTQLSQSLNATPSLHYLLEIMGGAMEVPELQTVGTESVSGAS